MKTTTLSSRSALFLVLLPLWISISEAHGLSQEANLILPESRHFVQHFPISNRCQGWVCLPRGGSNDGVQSSTDQEEIESEAAQKMETEEGDEPPIDTIHPNEEHVTDDNDDEDSEHAEVSDEVNDWDQVQTRHHSIDANDWFDDDDLTDIADDNGTLSKDLEAGDNILEANDEAVIEEEDEQKTYDLDSTKEQSNKDDELLERSDDGDWEENPAGIDDNIEAEAIHIDNLPEEPKSTTETIEEDEDEQEGSLEEDVVDHEQEVEKESGNEPAIEGSPVGEKAVDYEPQDENGNDQESGNEVASESLGEEAVDQEPAVESSDEQETGNEFTVEASLGEKVSNYEPDGENSDEQDKVVVEESVGDELLNFEPEGKTSDEQDSGNRIEGSLEVDLDYEPESENVDMRESENNVAANDSVGEEVLDYESQDENVDKQENGNEVAIERSLGEGVEDYDISPTEQDSFEEAETDDDIALDYDSVANREPELAPAEVASGIDLEREVEEESTGGLGWDDNMAGTEGLNQEHTFAEDTPLEDEADTTEIELELANHQSTDDDSTAFVDRMELADAYDEVEPAFDRSVDDPSDDADARIAVDNPTIAVTPRDDIVTEDLGEQQGTPSDSLDASEPVEIEPVNIIPAAPLRPIVIDGEMERILTKELKFRLREVHALKPEIAAVMAEKRLQRPLEGMPPNWFKNGMVPKRTYNVLERVEKFASRTRIVPRMAVPIVLSALAIYGVVDVGKMMSSISTSKKESGSATEESVSDMILEETLATSLVAEIVAPFNNTSPSEGSIVPFTQPKPPDDLDETWLDKVITMFGKPFKSFFNITI